MLKNFFSFDRISRRPQRSGPYCSFADEADQHVEQAAKSVVFWHLILRARRPAILPTRNMSSILLAVFGYFSMLLA
jgi:hypothetical protein